jgi:hypothetical protein
MAKARGYTISIEAMNAEQRGRTPSAALGKDYNNLLNAVVTLHPDLKNVLPPSAEFGGQGREFTITPYGEIHLYCEQLFQILSEHSE